MRVCMFGCLCVCIEIAFLCIYRKTSIIDIYVQLNILKQQTVIVHIFISCAVVCLFVCLFVYLFVLFIYLFI